jgi:hypothetical protein
MRFEKSIEIDAPQQRVWDVLTDVAAWPQVIDTVEEAELLTPPPMAAGSRARLKQPRLGEGIWEVTAWDAPSSFVWRQKSSGVTTDAGHRVEALGDGRSRLTLTLDMRGLPVPVFGRMFRGLTNDYMAREAQGIKRAAESA